MRVVFDVKLVNKELLDFLFLPRFSLTETVDELLFFILTELWETAVPEVRCEKAKTTLFHRSAHRLPVGPDFPTSSAASASDVPL